MKNFLYFLVVSFGMLFGCAKESINDENLDLKKAKVPVPMKAEFCMTPDPATPPVKVQGTPLYHPVTGALIFPAAFLPGAGSISGHATHMGEVITGESPMTTVSCYLDIPHLMATQEPVVVANYAGKITADNGDYYKFTATLNVVLPGMTFTGQVYMFDGTGNFEGMTGTVDVAGQGNPATKISCWTGTGTMVFEGK